MGLSIKKGDTVRVISGAEGPNGGEPASGTVLTVFPKKGTAIVEGVNVRRKHQRAQGQDRQGGIVDKEMPIPLCKLMLVDPATGVASRFSNARDEKGNKVRRLKTTGKEV